MAQTQLEKDTVLKALAFDAVQSFEQVQSPPEILSKLKTFSFFKHVSYAAIVLFEESLESNQQYAVVVAVSPEILDTSSPLQRYYSQDISWFWEASTHIPFSVDDISTDPRLVNIAHPFDDDMLHSLLAVALLVNNTHIGWLVVAHHKANAFTPTDARFLQLLAPPLAIAVHMQRRLNNTQIQLDRMTHILNASQQFLNDTSTLENVYSQVTKAFILANVDVCLLAVPFSGKGAPVEIVAIDKKDTVTVEIDNFIGHSYNLDDYPEFSTVGKNNQVFNVENVSEYSAFSEDEHAFLAQLGLQSIIILPLNTASRKIDGYILLGFSQVITLDENQIDFYQLMAQQAGFAIDHTRQLSGIQQYARQLQTGAEIAQITTALQNEDELLRLAVERIKEGFNLYYVGIFLVDDAMQWAVLRIGSGEAGEKQVAAGHKLAIQDEGSMIGWSISQQKARIALDVGVDAVHFSNPYLPKTRSEMALPLTSQNEVLGALTIQSTERAAFSDENITALQIMADELATAIRNARLYQAVIRASQETNTLLEINRDISASTNLPELLQSIVTHAVQLADADQGTIFLLEEDTLISQAVSGDYHREEMATLRVQMGEGVSGLAASTEQTVTKIYAAGEGVQIPGTQLLPEALIAVPIKTESKLIGVLLIRRINNVHGFSQSDIDLLEGLALQAAIAWLNLTLLASVERNLRRERVIRQVVAKVHASSGVENILQATVTELSKALNTHGGAVQLNLNKENNNHQMK